MNRRIRSQSAATKPETTFLRFLKPGALAQLRDSKINARSHLRSPESQICLPAGIIHQQQDRQDVAGNLTTADAELPLFSARFYAPRCLQRKKLMAVRSMCYLSHSANGLASDGSVAVIDVL